MSLERERLVGLIEFAEQTARLRSVPVATISQHGQFAFFEHQSSELPGVHLNFVGADPDDEVWLRLERLHEGRPPGVESVFLQPWIQVPAGPDERPRLRDTVNGTSLIAAGTHRSSLDSSDDPKPQVDPDGTLTLSEFDHEGIVRSDFAEYMETRWLAWAIAERRTRESISLYSKIFTLHQQLAGDIAEAPLELVWGVGMGVWATPRGAVSYPLLSQLVEVSLETGTAAIEVRPRDLEPRLELDWYAAVDNPGVAAAERSVKAVLESADATFSPFDRGTFEPALRAASAHLDANGAYWPDQIVPDDRTIPSASHELRVTDTWVLFARPRTNSLFLNDLRALKEKAQESESYPPAVAAIVTDPKTSSAQIDLPLFRGAWTSGESGHERPGVPVHELYFPKPFNDEQVRIIQLLEVSDGVVVQGPPGTGKTHTIANVICHYLAQGKRVLVTSMKDPALAVLHDQLPPEIQPLAIALLSSERDGMKQFEHAIGKIASEVQRLDPAATAKEIRRIEDSIDALHAHLASTDRKIGEWARMNLSEISLEDETIEPESAARELMARAGDFEWLPDTLGIGAEYAPRFSSGDVASLRDSRRILGRDIEYLGVALPLISDFPDPQTLLSVHQDLSRFEVLSDAVNRGMVPALADATQETLNDAQGLLDDIGTLAQSRVGIALDGFPWTPLMIAHIRQGIPVALIDMADSLGSELAVAADRRHVYLERPVDAPEGVENDSNLTQAIANLSEGRRPFGLMGGVGKAEQKRRLDTLRVLAVAPRSTGEWSHVQSYLAFRKRCAELALRWNVLASELGLSSVPEGPQGAVLADRNYRVFSLCRIAVRVEQRIADRIVRVFPTFNAPGEVVEDASRLAELEQALRHHLARNRLADVWRSRELFQQAVDGKSGSIVRDFARFLADTLGNPAVPDVRMQSEWSVLTAELARVLALQGELSTVNRICESIRDSGAPLFAEMLTKPVAGATDELLPVNLAKSWRLRRLACHLDSVETQDDFKQLTEARRETEKALSRGFNELVVLKTWLKLAENASNSVRSALQAYLAAIQKIGKTGKGKRAPRYRRDARIAAAHANPAVPCWIMPHYRVSESLPAELGCFDLVIVDEASQSDLTALPALLRAKKILVVGDDKQVSPDAVGLEEAKIVSLMSRFLGNQVETFRPQMAPTSSIYDLFKVVFAANSVMLREHFRCVAPIIEYSKREFYNHELSPLRLPLASERLDPPLVDVLVRDGNRQGDENRPEARFIVDEIKRITADPNLASRSIGVVSLLADKQARLIWEILTRELGPEIIQRHRIACGDARTFQGKERDIMFLSMIAAPNNLGASLSRDTFAQRFNVAASRARDRMYLVRSVELTELSTADVHRRTLISHFRAPFAQDEARVSDLRELCKSPFEREMYDDLTARGYFVTPQVHIGKYWVDFLVEGDNDTRLVVECDGDRYHGPDRWDADMQRQRVLERTGLVFWRCFASAFVRRHGEVLDDLVNTLRGRGIEPIGDRGAPRSVYTEHREVLAFAVPGVAPDLPNDSSDSDSSAYPNTTAFPQPKVMREAQTADFDVAESQPSGTIEESGDSGIIVASGVPPPTGALPASVGPFKQYEDAELWELRTGGPLRSELDATLKPLIARVVSVETPVHFDTIMERLRRRYSMGRAEESTRSHVLACIVRLAASGTVEMSRRDAGFDLFLSLPGAPLVPRSPGASALRRPEHIAAPELMAGVRSVLGTLGSASREDLITATARKFGFLRTSENMRAALADAINSLVQSELIAEFHGHLRGREQ